MSHRYLGNFLEVYSSVTSRKYTGTAGYEFYQVQDFAARSWRNGR